MLPVQTRADTARNAGTVRIKPVGTRRTARPGSRVEVPLVLA
jgi:hypothetical protein